MPLFEGLLTLWISTWTCLCWSCCARVTTSRSTAGTPVKPRVTQVSIGSWAHHCHREDVIVTFFPFASFTESSIRSLFWLNKLLTLLWTVESSGGLGPYYSSIIQEFLSYQLQIVPPSIAHLSIKKFSIGSIPPVRS